MNPYANALILVNKFKINNYGHWGEDLKDDREMFFIDYHHNEDSESISKIFEIYFHDSIEINNYKANYITCISVIGSYFAALYGSLNLIKFLLLTKYYNRQARLV